MHWIRDPYLSGRITIYVPSPLLVELVNALRYVSDLTLTA